MSHNSARAAGAHSLEAVRGGNGGRPEGGEAEPLGIGGNWEPAAGREGRPWREAGLVRGMPHRAGGGCRGRSSLGRGAGVMAGRGGSRLATQLLRATNVAEVAGVGSGKDKKEFFPKVLVPSSVEERGGECRRLTVQGGGNDR